MVEIAVYSDQQHEQFTCSASRFALCKSSATPARWLLCAGEDLENNVDPSTTELVQFGLTEQGVVVDGSAARPLPCTMQIGQDWFEIAEPIVRQDLVPLQNTDLTEIFSSASADASHAGPAAATVTKWLTEVGQLHRASACSPQFYADATRFAVETVGLDAAWVLKRDLDATQPTWQIVGSLLSDPGHGVRYESSVLEYLERERVAWYQPAPPAGQFSLCSQAVVVAPVFDSEDNLTAAVYGIRNTHGENRRQGIRPLEARLIQLLAESVAVGITRLEQETKAARTRVLLEHAFSPTVASYIEQHPECLSGQERDVTLLFADLRGYTTLAETLEPADCYALLGDVMEALTQVVIAQRGVVVDYYGDGLLALWNAPLEQPNHAELACLAATEMFDRLPVVGDKWQNRLGGPLELGIGIHSGPAQVGNAGTHSRLKYGPRGNTVNVASRVQAASKQLQLPLVITAATQTKLTSKFFTLRACTAKLPGLEQPTELFTVYPAAEAAQVKSRLDQYARALQLFESGQLDEAEQLLSKLVQLGQATPAHFLAHYTSAQKNKNLGRRAVDKFAAQSGSVIEITSK